ncbi:MAG TPA: DsrE family protein [Spirochaeta sp.]|nr:DsrE family protein [Spirochaeta sp.]
MTKDLTILWTNDNSITAEKMVFMYGGNALRKGWWESVTIVIWGATAELAANDSKIRLRIREMIATGVKFSACRSCAEQLGVAENLEELGVEVIYWGEPLTKILKSGNTLLTV